MSLPISLQETIKKMTQLFPWYQRLLELQGVQELSLPAADLGGLPLINASVLEEHYYNDSNPMALNSGLARYQTSGTSSGRRKTIYYSETDEADYLRIKLDVFRQILRDNSFQTAMADMGTGHAEATAIAVFQKLGMRVESVSFRLPLEQHLERLGCFRPEVLYAMPSILERIIQASDNPAAYGIRHIILVGEIASPQWIEQVAAQMGIGVEQITDTYGSIELGTIAYYSSKHGRYLLAEGLIAEGMNPEELGEGLEALSVPEEQVLVLTSVVRGYFPALRYVTYDVVRDLRTILIEGVPRQSFQCLVKRIGADLKHGEKISIYDIENVVFRHLSKASVRVKVAGNRLDVYVYSPEATDLKLEIIRGELERKIPEIGLMVRARILAGIKVSRGNYSDFLIGSPLKHKKIFYE